MRRRALLASLGALSAGCLGSGSSDPTAVTRTATTRSTSESPVSTTERPTSTPESSETTTEADETTSESPETPEPDAEFELTDLAVSTRTERPSVRYVLEPSAFYSADAVEREETETGEEQIVRDVSEISGPNVREAVETALEGGEWRSNDLPEGLADLVKRVDFFTGAGATGTHTHVGLELHRLSPDAPPAVEFDAEVVDSYVSPDDPGVVALSLTNASSEPRTVFSGTVPPFGMVFAESVESDDRFLLWRPYELEGCVQFTDDGYAKCAIGKTTKLSPGETVSREYEVLPSTTANRPRYTVPPGPGRYRISDSLTHYAKTGAPESKLTFEAEFSLQSR
ncbi:hypothetical protein [Halorussus ruber]|uniref:hypothetical protein n=1 Tax=Halorussus ruber TaxID=1126238 RepID=UPI00143CCABA|nr:hypothetical protein [Halorussus ruber]